MGDRGQVHIKDEGVWLYSHWGATDLIETVRTALKKKWRWYDPEYLARIIFDEMIGGEQGGEAGYGIGKAQHGDVWRVIKLDCKAGKITVEDDGKQILEQTFDEFIA